MLVVERVSANDARACGVINCADECGPAVNICSGIKSLLWNRAASALFRFPRTHRKAFFDTPKRLVYFGKIVFLFRRSVIKFIVVLHIYLS